MKPKLATYFHFTRSERNGFIGLILLCLIIIVFPHLYAYLFKPSNTNYTNYKAEIAAFKSAQAIQIKEELAEKTEIELFFFDPNLASVSEFQQLGLSKQVAKTIEKYREKGGRFKAPDDFGKIYTLSDEDFKRLKPYIKIETVAKETLDKTKEKNTATEFEPFKFDPNIASEADLARLGLAQNTVKAIVNYRGKGGKFKTKTDLQKIYTLSEADYARLEAYIEISLQKAAQNEQQLAFRKADEGESPDVYESSPIRIDINQSTADDWQQIRGIGSGYARRIIQFRDALGGFLSVEQVAQTRGLPDSTFQQIRPFLIESPILLYIDINTSTLDILKAHPYINWKQARLLVNFRRQHGPYQSLKDIQKIRALKTEDIELFAPYIRFDKQN